MKQYNVDKTVQPKHRDIPGQLGLTRSQEDVYVSPPDKACAVNAMPLAVPEKKKLPKVKERRQKFNLNNPSLIQYVDMDGNHLETKSCPIKRNTKKK